MPEQSISAYERGAQKDSIRYTATGHKWLGALLLLPVFVWCISGAIFLFKPGYGDAYSPLPLRTYPLENYPLEKDVPENYAPEEHTLGTQALDSNAFNTSHNIERPAGWQEYRVVRSILGEHLLVRKQDNWQQLDRKHFTQREKPSDANVIRLLEDAITINPNRYGRHVSKEHDTFVSENGVRLSLDWSTMSLQQYGRDRQLIDLLYDLHYLRWSGHGIIDQVWGITALGSLLLSLILGARLLFSRNKSNHKNSDNRDC